MLNSSKDCGLSFNLQMLLESDWLMSDLHLVLMVSPTWNKDFIADLKIHSFFANTSWKISQTPGSLL